MKTKRQLFRAMCVPPKDSETCSSGQVVFGALLCLFVGINGCNCIDDRTLPEIEVPDAGVDGGAVEGQVQDASFVDAGLHPTFFDAGSVDAGPQRIHFDGGITDSGLPENNWDSGATACDSALAETALVTALNNASTDAAFTLLLRDSGGREFSHSVGNSSAETIYESASTSKWVTAMVILHLVDEGLLSLEDHPQDYISFWTSDVQNPLSAITLAQLLGFTSGLEQNPLCVHVGAADFENCVETIHTRNLETPVQPGTGFYYGPSHMQVAGLMAIHAALASNWNEVFTNFQSETGLFPNAVYDLPSAAHPRLAGGMHWRADEYLDFLGAVFHSQIISPELEMDILLDQVVGLSIVESPIHEVGEEWHYGFGFWLECRSESYTCTSVTRISCPGAYGAYPFIDYSGQYFGILGRQGSSGSFPQGLALLDTVQSEIDAWAACRP